MQRLFRKFLLAFQLEFALDEESLEDARSSQTQQHVMRSLSQSLLDKKKRKQAYEKRPQ